MTVVISARDVVVGESDGYADVVVSLSAQSMQAVTVKYETSDGTATRFGSAFDYANVSGTLTFAPLETSRTVRVPIKNDLNKEGTQGLYLFLSSPSANAQVGKSSSVISIVDNDAPAGIPNISVRDAVVDETSKFAQFVVMLDKPSMTTVGLNYSTVSGTANSGSDFTAASGSLSFAPGETSKTVLVAISDDTITEVDELFSLLLSNPTNGTLAQASATGRITANDAAAVTSPVVSAGDVVVGESDGYADVVVSLSAPSTQSVTVKYETSDGTATRFGSAFDYANVSGTLTFAPGVTSLVVRVPIRDDMFVLRDDVFVDGTEGLFFILSSPSANVQVGKSSSVISIVENDAQTGTPSISVRDAIVGETGQAAQFVVTLDKPSTATVGVSYSTVGGTASSGADFAAASGSLSFAPGETSKTVLVAISDDTITEVDELFSLLLSNPTNSTLAQSSATGRITANDAAAVTSPVVSAGDVVVGESDGYADVVVSLSAPSTQSVSVKYETSDGTATRFGSAFDYANVSGTLTFAPGVTSLVVRVPIRDDTVFETTESFLFKLSSPSANASIGNTQATITIYDGNSKPTPAPTSFTVTSSDVSVNEGASLTYTVNTTGLASGTVLGYELTGISTSDVVGGNLTGNIAIGANGQGSVSVSLAADQQTEGNETLVLNLLNGGIAVGAAAPVTVVDTSKATSPPVLPPLGPTDDFVVLQPSTSAIAGAGVGNDVYLLSGSMLPPGKAITISDAIGTNTLQLAPGLSVISSQVASTALKLSLSNGASVTVLGADKFAFDVGGNLSTGLNPADLSYSQFVQNNLGTTIPSTGVANGTGLSVGSGPAASLLASTSPGNDFIVAQTTSAAIIGGGLGNDTYLLSPDLLSAGTQISISDALGANSVQLANGLQIASAQVAATALRLNLTNGASITVLGADRFTFEAGGNTTAGIDLPDLNYSQFVQSVLGTSVPTTGIVTSGALTIGGAALNGLLIVNDRLLIDLPTVNSSLTNGDQLDGGQPVTLSLVGVSDAAAVQIQVV